MYREDGDLSALFEPDVVQEALERTLQRVGDLFYERVRLYTPVQSALEAAEAHRMPGQLRRSWRIRYADQSSDELSVEVFTDDRIAPYVEHNTRPHEIRPRLDREPATVIETGKARATREAEVMHRKPTAQEIEHRVVGKAALRFLEDGRVVYARMVFHPGTRGAHMMARALQDVRVAWEHIVQDELARAGAELERRASA